MAGVGTLLWQSVPCVTGTLHPRGEVRSFTADGAVLIVTFRKRRTRASSGVWFKPPSRASVEPGSSGARLGGSSAPIGSFPTGVA